MVKTHRMVLEDGIASEMWRLNLKYFGDQSFENPTLVPFLPTYLKMLENEAAEAEEIFYCRWRFHHIVLIGEQRWVCLYILTEDKVGETDVRTGLTAGLLDFDAELPVREVQLEGLDGFGRERKYEHHFYEQMFQEIVVDPADQKIYVRELTVDEIELEDVRIAGGYLIGCGSPGHQGCFSLIGRLDLLKVKLVVARTEAMNKWNLSGSCQFIPLDYWEDDVLMPITRTVGNLVQVDSNTLCRHMGFYASVLVDVDFSKPIPNKIMVEREGFVLCQEIQLGRTPKICPHCKNKPGNEKAGEGQKKDDKLKEPIVDKTPSTNHPNLQHKTYKGVVELWDRTIRNWEGLQNSQEVGKEASLVNKSWADMVKEIDSSNQFNAEEVENEDSSGSESHFSEYSSNLDKGYSEDVVYQAQEAEEWHNVLSVRGAIEDVRSHSSWVIGDGASIDLWRDNWCSPISLKDWINNDCIPWKDLDARTNTLANEKRKWIKQIRETVVLSSGFMYNNQTDMSIVHCLGVAVRPCYHPMVKSYFWELPQKDEIKINTDGAARGNHGKGGIGCIFRNSDGKVLGSLLKGLGLVTNYMAECEAIIHGVDYAASVGWLIAWIELDSTTAVEAFK
ncbi:hypothetical protein GIB67_025912 [Kingdonia uniflora]|uniref:RNase H type-1 domain-containing protein n=1 Tax=Kingdonia uniflora TaxID=39325 RepID=A0A7J7NZ08_9MAGN|nr:hypothetical protein GIB67_025912 [Kingdonia uniflora]